MTREPPELQAADLPAHDPITGEAAELSAEQKAASLVAGRYLPLKGRRPKHSVAGEHPASTPAEGGNQPGLAS